MRDVLYDTEQLSTNRAMVVPTGGGRWSSHTTSGTIVRAGRRAESEWGFVMGGVMCGVMVSFQRFFSFIVVMSPSSILWE